ncbi:MAG TPA: alkaline phosphatase family protein [Microthrixaceae bacterium]|nr:alkaline phosphatase family protein [Microthrixaceae bacterium]
MERRPNVLLITLDQFRADCLGVAGHPVVSTPNLDRLAARGVRFTRHFSNCAPCAPSRASLLTGLWQMNHRVTNNGAPLADDLPMLPRLLREVGYAPALFGYTDTALDPRTLTPEDPRRRTWEEPMPGFDVELLLDEQIGPWLEWLAARGYEVPGDGEDPTRIYEPADVPVPEGRGATWRPARYRAEHTESAFVTEAVLDWLSRPGRAEEPWCAHVSYLRPHPPYLAPEPYHDLVDPAEVPDPVRHPTRDREAALHPFVEAAQVIVPSPDDPLDQRQLQATYYGMVTEVDHQVGRVLDHLDATGMADDTLVVLTSDHGEQLGDHWLVEKLGFFDQSFHIPLIVRWPAGGRAGATVDAFTENVDVLPTILDLVGSRPPDFCDGASLRPFVEGDGAAPPTWRQAVHWEYDFRDPTSDLVEAVLGLRQDQACLAVLRSDHGKYVHFAGGLPPLWFDLDDDPHELVDRSTDPAATAKVLDHAQQLLTLRLEHADPRLANTRATADGTVHRADPPRPHPPAR